MRRVMPLVAVLAVCGTYAVGNYVVVDTGQIRCYDNRTEIRYPQNTQAFLGQDAQYNGNQPSYRDNDDGTVTDLNTGLMWQSDPGKKKTYAEAVVGSEKCRIGGYEDWRLPTIKELYSLIQFSGIDPDPRSHDAGSSIPFIDTNLFKFQYGNPEGGDRIIDSQWPQGHGPQGDAQRINNLVRCVRRGMAEPRAKGPEFETKAFPMPPAGSGFVGHLDRDGDGMVSRKEFDGPAGHFDVLDKDGDGYLSESEVPPPPGRRPAF